MRYDPKDRDNLQQQLKDELACKPDLPPLTYQESHFVTAVAAGVSLPVAATRSGVSVSTGYKWMAREDINIHLLHLKEEREANMSAEVRYTLEDAHLDIEHAKRMAVNSMEYLRGVDMQIKIHGIGAEQNRHNPAVQININNVHRAEQLEELDDDALLELAGDDFRRLQPENG